MTIWVNNGIPRSDPNPPPPRPADGGRVSSDSDRTIRPVPRRSFGRRLFGLGPSSQEGAQSLPTQAGGQARLFDEDVVVGGIIYYALLVFPTLRPERLILATVTTHFIRRVNPTVEQIGLVEGPLPLSAIIPPGFPVWRPDPEEPPSTRRSGSRSLGALLPAARRASRAAAQTAAIGELGYFWVPQPVVVGLLLFRLGVDERGSGREMVAEVWRTEPTEGSETATEEDVLHLMRREVEAAFATDDPSVERREEWLRARGTGGEIRWNTFLEGLGEYCVVSYFE
ncbi:hypothetical protein M501DRAFT_1052627 [Patellaria atrata CBS 101060]|uniref:Uncharacterized protein n=1 Tax=Patellaria atrata CBS 101060 TaxID=1346257 RepID=A0A9P4SAH0_9PEZI|nr:hypothetical protein M501DRAFT_1052627 [Patellaria atrata CBS 101060]